ncbi:peptide/nickel transport system permease protein [Loktanella fryxellensis]|uniref:Peptide/nickel transport system permease protein n=2 Tax=Loktanella fryxellensis TaxID=245187 RepID=A0A1H8IEC3_9RHOB|nr:peptide/nickel transport system permease protein [Loktanella fryxellensis]
MPLDWTGTPGALLNPLLAASVGLWLTLLALRLVAALVAVWRATPVAPGLRRASLWAGRALGLVTCAYVLAGMILPAGTTGIVGGVIARFAPAILTVATVIGLSVGLRRRLGVFGLPFHSTVGTIGAALVLFWVVTALLYGGFGLIATHDPLRPISSLRNALPGSPVPEAGLYPHYLLGGDSLARDVFSRMVAGSVIVLTIAPLATLTAVLVGLSLGLPAGYLGGWTDRVLSFAANLILAFPVILLFYLLVTPEVASSALPPVMAAVLFGAPLAFVAVLVHSRLRTQPGRNALTLAAVLVPLAWLWAAVVSQAGTPVTFLPARLDPLDPDRGLLVVFVAVVFVNAPIVFRIVRGLTLDIRTRDYVAAARTRGETPAYIMLWEVLPNARGPLIVDTCLRIGYTTILLGTLGFFGLGLPPESPDWGSTINEGRKLLLVYVHPALPPAAALLSLVLGLNLLADGLREQSMADR